MGAEMCLRLVQAGHDVSVWNRTAAKAQPLVDAGARLVGSPRELADRDVVFTMVAASEDLKAVTTGADGLLTDASVAPEVLIDSSTVSVGASEAVRSAAKERGCTLLAAPVSGNPSTISVGRLTFAVSGPRATYDLARPILLDIGREATYVGEDDAARLVKICHNVFLGVVAQSLAEITVLAQKGGIRRSDFLAFLNDSVMGSTFTRYKTPALVNLDYTVTFTPALLRKDLDLGLAAGEELAVELPVAEVVRGIVDAMVKGGYDDVDFAALLEVAARASDLHLEPENRPVTDGLTPIA
jgi:3-hydroxyisobutyrate dehydrogenase-like beta-hydroxyacid dehydrogenase